MSDNITLPREVVQGALEALVWEAGLTPTMYAAKTGRAITALRTHLACDLEHARRPEPVAFNCPKCGRHDYGLYGQCLRCSAQPAPPTAAPEPVFDGQSGHPVMLPRAPEPVLGLISDEVRAALKATDAVESQEAYRTRAVAPRPEPESKTPAWWVDGLTVTLMREGVNKHRAREIAKGYWEAYCQIEEDIESLRRDAERYRWLRENAYVWGSNERVRSDMQVEAVAIWLLGTTDMTEPGIDAAIDAAMQEV